MKNIVNKWNNFLNGLSEDRVENVACSFEFLHQYLTLENFDSKELEILIFPIIYRIGDKINLKILDIVKIVDEVNDEISKFDFKYPVDDGEEDGELIFCRKNSNRKIEELKLS